MGTARFETITDYIRREVDIAIRCLGCGHTRDMKADSLVAIFGLSVRVAEVKRRLRCRQCGHKGAKLAPIPKLKG